MKTNFGVINKYIIFGGGVLCSRFVEYLKESGRDFIVVTSPRHAEGIIAQEEKTAFKDFLTKNGAPFYISSDISADKKVDKEITEGALGISFGAAWIFKKGFIDKFGGRLLNVHGSRLPKYRGGGGFSWYILQDDLQGNSLIHLVDEGVDTGPIVKQKEFSYPSSCRVPGDYHDFYVKATSGFLKDFVEEVDAQKDFKLLEQNNDFSVYWPRLSTETQGYINWSWSLDEIDRFIRAFSHPYKGASTFVRGMRVFLHGCGVSFSEGTFHPFQDGLVYRKTRDALRVSKKEGTLIISSVLDDKGGDVKNKVNTGDRLYTPGRYLEDAMLFRGSYTPDG